MPPTEYVAHIDAQSESLPITDVSVFIMCAGLGDRWKAPYPKQLATIDGIPNVKRTIKQLKEAGIPDTDIVVIVNHNVCDQYPTDLNILIVPPSNREINRFRNAFAVADHGKRLIYLYGDVVYDINDLLMIVTTKTDAFVGSAGNNRLTHKKYGEIYAVIVCDVQQFKNDVNDVAHKFETKQITREIGWEVYSNHRSHYNFVNTTGSTDDYDTIEEYEILKRLYER